MVNFYDKYINCEPTNQTNATLGQVAGTILFLYSTMSCVGLSVNSIIILGLYLVSHALTFVISRGSCLKTRP